MANKILRFTIKKITKNINNNAIIAGFPAKDIKLWKKEIIRNSLRK